VPGGIGKLQMENLKISYVKVHTTVLIISYFKLSAVLMKSPDVVVRMAKMIHLPLSSHAKSLKIPHLGLGALIL